MKLGFIKPNFKNEKRVALLPKDIREFENEIAIEKGFGEYLDITDEEYLKVGCKILSREEIFHNCDAIFSLKLIQELDYKYIKNNQMIIGWIHPTGSGDKFMEFQAIPKNLVIVDLDNIYPAVYYNNKKHVIDWIPRNFVSGNSFIAGFASTVHALISYGFIPNSETKVAILSPGNVSQGAFSAITKFGAETRLYYRKTMDEFKSKIGDYDIIINGIEVSSKENHIINKQELKKVKKNCLIIDAAADAGNAIEGTHYTSIDKPIYKEDDLYFYVVNNAPSIFYRNASMIISKSFSEHVFREDVQKFLKLVMGK